MSISQVEASVEAGWWSTTYNYCTCGKIDFGWAFWAKNIYRVSQLNYRLARNILLIKNPKFSSNYYDTWSKWLTNELAILTEFHNYWIEIVYYLLMEYFWTTGKFSWDTLYNIWNYMYLQYLKLYLRN